VLAPAWRGARRFVDLVRGPIHGRTPGDAEKARRAFDFCPKFTWGADATRRREAFGVLEVFAEDARRLGDERDAGAETIFIFHQYFFSYSTLIMPRLDNSQNILQPGIHMGPATIVLEDLADTGSLLRERTTTAWKSNWTEQPYDFPNSYVNIPQRVMGWNPISTYVDDQNTRFAQRYFSSK
jgi:hypothetical protein